MESIKRKLYALLVGIDEYPSGIPQLKGCINDIRAINDVLNKEYAFLSPQILLLENREATRENIIDCFRTHLSKATENDTVLFYYSGHGSRENSPQEFWQEFPNRKNETLVCYDSRIDGGFDLADKEIAVLLNEVASQKPHIIVCLDSCHSGSGTRDSITLGAVRQVEKEGNTRKLESYLDGYYATQLNGDGKLIVPNPKHLLLSACQDTEKAYETTTNHGLFTTVLLECLSKKIKGNFTYSELYQEVSLKVRLTQNSQHPNFEYLNGFNPHSLFLTGTATDRVRTFPIYFDALQKKWIAGKGSIHGISTENTSQIKLWIFENNVTSYSEEQSITKAYFEEVSPKDSTIRIEASLDQTQTYLGYEVDGGIKNVSIFSEIDSKELIALFEFQVTGIRENADYLILKESEKFQIIHNLSQKIIVENTDLASINIALQKIARWENLKKLKNSKSKLRTDDIQVKFDVISEQDTLHSFTENEIEVSLNVLDNGETETRGYRILVNNSSGKDLYFKLLFISPLYGILQIGDVNVPNGREGELINSDFGFFPEQKEDSESNCFFKIVGSTESMDFSYFNQENFSLNTDFRTIAERAAGDSKFLPQMGSVNYTLNNSLDWFTKHVKLRLLKSKSKIGSENIALSNGDILIKSHPILKAKISISDNFNASRGVESHATFLQSAINLHGISVLGLSPSTKSVLQPQIIELKEIEGNISEKEPLVIVINDIGINEDEIILPVALDGDTLLVIGNSKAFEDGKREVYIEQLPETDQENTRSLGRAIKFCLMKLVLKSNPDSYFQLQWVDFDEKNPIRKDDNIKQKVQDANSILLLVHGIIGDTEGMIPFVKTITKSKNTPENQYDLALTFDYECLNTPIEKIAQNLIIELANAGISDTTGKKVTIIAHSMGGLVSRTMIEQYHKGGLVEKLIMAGTPNGGSNFGKVPSYLSLASDAITLGLSAAFVAPYLSWAAGLVVALKKSEKLTVTLAQMEQNSDFIRGLRVYQDPKVPYYILAGRIDQYKISEGSWFQKLLTKLTLSVGNTFHKGEQHDIAVYTSDIQKIDDNRSPKPIKSEVGCPHIFYYDEPDSKAIMYGWLHK